MAKEASEHDPPVAHDDDCTCEVPAKIVFVGLGVRVRVRRRDAQDGKDTDISG